MSWDPTQATHRHKRNGLECQVLGERNGVVTYMVPWSYLPRDRDSTSFHAVYKPIGEPE